jgi:hypothetical protein
MVKAKERAAWRSEVDRLLGIGGRELFHQQVPGR